MKKYISIITAAVSAVCALAPLQAMAFDPLNDTSRSEDYIKSHNLTLIDEKYYDYFQYGYSMDSGILKKYQYFTDNDRTRLYTKRKTNSNELVVLTMKDSSLFSEIENTVRAVQSDAVIERGSGLKLILKAYRSNFKHICTDLRENDLITDFEIFAEFIIHEDFIPGSFLCCFGGSDGDAEKVIDYIRENNLSVELGIGHPKVVNGKRYICSIRGSGFSKCYDFVYDNITEYETVTNGSGSVMERYFSDYDVLMLNPNKNMSLDEHLSLAFDIYKAKDVYLLTATDDSVEDYTCLESVSVFSCVNGDANCDGVLSIADSTIILQSLGNPDRYVLSDKGKYNADIYLTGDGITGMDSYYIQMLLG